MDISLREAATIIGRKPRTLRAQLARGEIPGNKRNGRWFIAYQDLPLNEMQRRRLQVQVQEIREAVEQALPSRLTKERNSRKRSLADLDTFNIGRELLLTMRSQLANTSLPIEILQKAICDVEYALTQISQGHHAFDPKEKLEKFQYGRNALSRAACHLLLHSGSSIKPPVLDWVVRIEGELLSSLAGLIRWAETRSKRKA